MLPPLPTRRGQPRFPTFEGLRAVAALAVLVYHAGTFAGVTVGPEVTHAGLAPWIHQLSVGVSIFFVLSGFLLFRPFVVAHLSETPAPAAVPFLARRLVRIYPAYWVALFLSVRLVDLELGDRWDQLRFYLLLQIYWSDTVIGGLIQAWSLCTEVSFYLFLPLWAWLLARRRGTVADKVRTHYRALGAMYLVGIAVRWWLRASGSGLGYATLPANADLFAIGMAMAVASAASSVRDRRPGGLLGLLGDQPGAAWLAAACCYASAVALRFPFGFEEPTVVQELAKQVLFGVIAGLVVAPGVVGHQDRGAIRRLLRWRPLVAIGVVSYGIYLWHVTVQGYLVAPQRPFDPPGLWLLVAASGVVSVALATLSWVVLERPLIERVRRLGRAGG